MVQTGQSKRRTQKQKEIDREESLSEFLMASSLPEAAERLHIHGTDCSSRMPLRNHTDTGTKTPLAKRLLTQTIEDEWAENLSSSSSSG